MEHTPTILHRLKRYPTYQFHAVISSDQLSQSEAFCRLILETFSWLRARLNGEMPEELNTPDPEKYADFSEDALHSFSLDQGWKANVTYVPERGIWAFSLHETDMGANHGTANERPPVQGRMFETDISFVIRRKLCYNNDNLKVPFRNYAAKINRNCAPRQGRMIEQVGSLHGKD